MAQWRDLSFRHSHSPPPRNSGFNLKLINKILICRRDTCGWGVAGSSSYQHQSQRKEQQNRCSAAAHPLPSFANPVNNNRSTKRWTGLTHLGVDKNIKLASELGDDLSFNQLVSEGSDAKETGIVGRRLMREIILRSKWINKVAFFVVPHSPSDPIWMLMLPKKQLLMCESHWPNNRQMNWRFFISNANFGVLWGTFTNSWPVYAVDLPNDPSPGPNPLIR